MKILLLSDNYTSKENIYASVFVHTRVKEYIKDHEVQVVNFTKTGEPYIYEGVSIIPTEDTEQIFKIYQEFKPDIIFIHFYNSRLYNIVKESNVPVLIWVHGIEALGWYRRLFNYKMHYFIKKTFSIIPENIRLMAGFRKMINFSNSYPRVRFIFVSDWMRRVAETDSLKKLKESFLIANPIDTKLFQFHQKHEDLRKRILLIRPFNTRKYANDVAIRAIEILSEKPFFHDLTFEIFGDGALFEPLTQKIKNYENVILNRRFIENHLIPEIHKRNGVFLCPTRQDAQGVSMCEAMSSGLVPIASNNTAIPEFISDGESGYLTNTAAEIASCIEELYLNKEKFLKMSEKAASEIRRTCSVDAIINSEYKIVTSMLNSDK